MTEIARRIEQAMPPVKMTDTNRENRIWWLTLRRNLLVQEAKLVHREIKELKKNA